MRSYIFKQLYFCVIADWYCTYPFRGFGNRQFVKLRIQRCVIKIEKDNCQLLCPKKRKWNGKKVLLLLVPFLVRSAAISGTFLALSWQKRTVFPGTYPATSAEFPVISRQLMRLGPALSGLGTPLFLSAKWRRRCQAKSRMAEEEIMDEQ